MTTDIRRTSITGIFEGEDDFPPVSVHFSEWWNGEGLDFTLTDDSIVRLHDAELSALVTIAIATGFVDIDACIQKAADMNKQSAQRDEDIKRIRALSGVDF